MKYAPPNDGVAIFSIHLRTRIRSLLFVKQYLHCVEIAI